jgi:hypothetical protein
VTHPARTTDCLDVVVDALAHHVGIDRRLIDADQPLSAIPDVESIHVLRAIASIEQSCEVIIPDDFLFESATVRELAVLVGGLVDRDA